MLTMTAREIKDALKRNRREGRRPRSLYEIAQMRGVHRSLITRAVQDRRRYPGVRAYIESLLVDSERKAS